MKLFDSELKVMDVLWRAGEDVPAREVARQLEESVGWNKNTTYTVIKKCVEKGAVQRLDPHFLCHPLVEKGQVQAREAKELVNKVFDGSVSLLFASLLSGGTLPGEEIEKLKRLVDELK